MSKVSSLPPAHLVPEREVRASHKKQPPLASKKKRCLLSFLLLFFSLSVVSFNSRRPFKWVDTLLEEGGMFSRLVEWVVCREMEWAASATTWSLGR
ncbi:hypothetical protein TNCV_878461 [Trichonephila clavipes]|nr:hypothetical protein TNCV_878461 [Trichonephila clavipes]